MNKELSLEEFLDKKRDFSPFLVHLTKNESDDAFFSLSAMETLDLILHEKTLRAYNHFCLFSPALNNENNDIRDKFKVVCFTETPIGQIDILLTKLAGRSFKPDPYGLVFKKEYIRKNGGNPVFYTSKEIAKPLWQLYSKESSQEICRLLALVTVCEEWNDWHWEREWRIVGDLNFKLTDVYCGLCPEENIQFFENKYSPIKFIDPSWGTNKILAKVVGK